MCASFPKVFLPCWQCQGANGTRIHVHAILHVVFDLKLGDLSRLLSTCGGRVHCFLQMFGSQPLLTFKD